jgi:hypothetical protein
MERKDILNQVNRFIRSVTFLMLAFLMFSVQAAYASTDSISSQSTLDLLIPQIMGLVYESHQSISSGPFSVGDSLKKAEKAWGKPEDLSTVAANYWSRNVRFHYDGSTGRKTITVIDDFDPKLQTIHLSMLKDLIGEPVSEVEQEGNYYVTYTDYVNYKVVFVFESAWIDPNPRLNMYTVEFAPD